MDPAGVATVTMRQPVLMKSVRVGAALLVLGAVLAGCSGESEPAPAAKPDPKIAYCEAYNAYFERSIDREATDAQRIASMKTFAADLTALDVPDMEPDVARGMDVWSQLIGEAPDDATQADMALLEADLTPEQGADIRAFLDWNTRTCSS